MPLLAELGQQFNFRSEFSPSPQETLEQVSRCYSQPRNLLVRFDRDGIDQSRRLLAVLRARPHDRSQLLELPGDHLSPSSAGLRRQLLGSWADDPSRQRTMERLATAIESWWGLRTSRTALWSRAVGRSMSEELVETSSPPSSQPGRQNASPQSGRTCGIPPLPSQPLAHALEHQPARAGRALADGGPADGLPRFAGCHPVQCRRPA